MYHNSTLEVDFGELAAVRFSSPPPAKRHLYHYLINLDQHYEELPHVYAYLTSAITQIGTIAQLPADATSLVRAVVELANDNRLKIDGLVPQAGLTEAQRAYLWREIAPMGLIDGCLLQNASIAATSEFVSVQFE